MMVPAKTDLKYREKGTSDWTCIEDTIGELQLDGLKLKKDTVYEICVRNRQPQVLADVTTEWICFYLSL